MTRIDYKISLKSAALLASGSSAGNLLETLDFVPGNSVRGVLARRYLTLNNDVVDEVFRNLFLHKQVRYGFAYLQGAQPIPSSARSCKYHGGFASDGKHGLVDLLLAPDRPQGCPNCRKPMDYYRGYWDAVRYRERIPQTRLTTRTAIDARLGAAKTRHLYTQKVLEEGQAFYGSIETSDPGLAEKLERLLQEPFSARIGTGGSRGQGWVEIGKPAANDPPCQIKWGSCQERYSRYADSVLAVTLLSDALFSDDYLRDSTHFPLKSLSAYGIDPEQWQTEPKKAYLETRLIHGFDGVPVQLPRVSRLAVAAGSVYLFRATLDTPAIPRHDGLVWVGERNDEGYGLAALWHPFHYQPDLAPTGEAPAVLNSRPAAPWLLNAQAVFKEGGYQHISAAQMAAVDNRIAQAATWQEAKNSVTAFLKHQLAKLKKKQDQGHRPASWQLPLTIQCEETLGARLLRWIGTEEYRSPGDAKEDRLALLRRAWSTFYGQYRYRLETGRFMALAETVKTKE